MNKNTRYITKILRIICLTNVIALLFLPWLWRESLSWICGSTLSLINLWLISLKIEKNLSSGKRKARLTAYKDFNLRYLILIIGSVLAVKFLSLNILVFGAGLVSGQIWILLSNLIRYSVTGTDQE